jgi:hypothetical protein
MRLSLYFLLLFVHFAHEAHCLSQTLTSVRLRKALIFGTRPIPLRIG